jgi:ABC-type lipoprotein release transport system permease subunit
MIDERDGATGIHLWLNDPSRIDTTVAALKASIKDATIASWRDTAGFVTGAIDANDTLTAISTTMVFFAVFIPVLAQCRSLKRLKFGNHR